ncbi:MAG: tRNA 2-thiouridine(34) synthase MnmA [Firmicutes bacterium]|nr:tRNA 2-thiouridine(34) synthase MnmA [Bacillota bacterium]
MLKKVLVGMSGGVDSSVAAALLIEQGYQVGGVTLCLFTPEGNDEQDELALAGREARRVCEELGIEHRVCDFRQQFKEQVIERFALLYAKGRTPNPCIDCNRYIKFRLLYQKAQTLGYNYIATGHYAQIEYCANQNRYLLKKAAYAAKDQSYVLYTLPQQILSATLFPLGGFSKEEARQFAAMRGLAVAKKPDSQDICFVPDGDYAAFLARLPGHAAAPGNFIDKTGRILGRHRGLVHYTIGQRKGLKLSFGAPRYVTGIDEIANTVTLGEAEELFGHKLVADDVNFISCEQLSDTLDVTVKTRYKQQETPATIRPLANGRVQVCFQYPQRALTPGQAVVFYSGDIVVGGGTIITSLD